MRCATIRPALGPGAARADALSDGIYHGAALSAVADGARRAHLVTRTHREALLRHYGRRDGAAPPLLEGTPNWGAATGHHAARTATRRLRQPHGDQNTSYSLLCQDFPCGLVQLCRQPRFERGLKAIRGPPPRPCPHLGRESALAVLGRDDQRGSGGSALLGSPRRRRQVRPRTTTSSGGGVEGCLRTPGTDEGGRRRQMQACPTQDPMRAWPDGGTDGRRCRTVEPTAARTVPSALLSPTDFNRSRTAGLGPNWTVSSAQITDTRAMRYRDGFAQRREGRPLARGGASTRGWYGFGTEMALTLAEAGRPRRIATTWPSQRGPAAQRRVARRAPPPVAGRDLGQRHRRSGEVSRHSLHRVGTTPVDAQPAGSPE